MDLNLTQVNACCVQPLEEKLAYQTQFRELFDAQDEMDEYWEELTTRSRNS